MAEPDSSAFPTSPPSDPATADVWILLQRRGATIEFSLGCKGQPPLQAKLSPPAVEELATILHRVGSRDLYSAQIIVRGRTVLTRDESMREGTP